MVQQNNFFAHIENILIAMLEDNDVDTQNMKVTKVLTVCQQISKENEEN